VPTVSVAEERHYDRSAGHGAALALVGLPALLAMEVALTLRQTQGTDCDPQRDPADE
jgi:hypothetical protein